MAEEEPVSARAGPSLDARDVGALRDRLALAVRRACPPWLAADADDIVQEALLKVLRAGAALVNARYLHRAATCATIDAVRRRRASRVAWGEAGEVDGVADDASPQQVAADRQLGAAIQDCMAEQPADRRRCLELYLLGHPVPELAALLGIQAKSADNLVYRGLKVLRACLGSKGYSA